MKTYVPLAALALLIGAAHAQTPNDMPAANSPGALPLDAMRHRQPTQSTIDQREQQRLGKARADEWERRQTDEIERIYQNLTGSSSPSR